MKFGVPWSVKGIRPEARETAREAARRSGMPLGEWLNSVILQQAEDDDLPLSDDMSIVHERLDDITRRLEQFTRAAQTAKPARRESHQDFRRDSRQESRQEPRHEPRHEQSRGDNDQIAQLIASLDRRLEQFAQTSQAQALQTQALQAQAFQAQALQAQTLQAQAAQAQAAKAQAAKAEAMQAQAAIAQAMRAHLQQSEAAQTLAPRMSAPPLVPSMTPSQATPPDRQPASTGIDRAVAEIAARQRALNGQPTVAPQPAEAPRQPAPLSAPQPAPPPDPGHMLYAPRPEPTPPPAPIFVPMPSQNLSGLEEHLRQITDQIETLRRPGVEDAINALRAELADIGQALNEAMPRQAIEAIERQIQGLTQRIAEGRQANEKANDKGGAAAANAAALAGVEQGLAEVRDALRGLTPAENLVGFNEAVDGLAHKIDMIVAQKDPETLGQLEHAITTLREMAGHVASNDAIGRLAAQVRELGEKVDHYGAAAGRGDALNNLEHRISALSDALVERSQSGDTVPPRLEALVESLSNKIEQIQQSRGDNVAAGHLEDQIVALVQRLDASDSRLGHLEAIERGLADLLVHIEEIRANKSSTGLREDTSPGVIELKHDIARTQEALNAVNGTLGHVVDRLAMIEKDFRQGGRSAHPESDILELTQPLGRVGVRSVVDPTTTAAQSEQQPAMSLAARLMAVPQAAAQAAAQTTAYADRPAAPQPVAPPRPPQQAAAQPVPPQRPPQQTAPRRPPAAVRPPINPNLPPDQPLEPGTTMPSMHASARIAASEAALGNSRPAQATELAGKSGFIAAARRAAQAAVETANPQPPRVEPAERHAVDADGRMSLRSSLMKKVKSLFIAASIVAVVIGSIQVAGNVFDFGVFNSHKPKVAQAPTSDDQGGKQTEPASNQATENDLSDANADIFNPNNTFSPQAEPRPATETITHSTGGGAIASKQPDAVHPASPSMPPLPNPPATNSPVAAPRTTAPSPNSSLLSQAGDITGSISHNPATEQPARAAAPPAIPDADRLPSAIGSVKLRSAAVAGDGPAAYEIALRYSDGRGVPADPTEAARWYERAAAKGLAPAEFRYASLLEKGVGVKKNLGQARRLYLAAAAKGHAKAMHNLAVLYAEGIDGKPNYATAVKWFTKAAQHGIADSQYNLGVLCARGLGTEKNLEEAYKWFALAAQQGDHEAGKKRDEIAGRLDADALAGAERAVKDFVAVPQPAAALNVPMPRGGWDDASGAAAPAPRGSTAKSGAKSAVKINTRVHSGRAASSHSAINLADVARQ
jgi:localization factor PodJL